MRILGLSMLLLAGLGAGWVLGKAVMGPSRINQPQTDVSAERTIEDKSTNSVTETAAIIDTEAKAEVPDELQYEPQDQSSQDSLSGRGRNSGQARRALASPKPRGGPGIGVITKPIKVVFKPLRRVNPLRLRLW